MIRKPEQEEDANERAAAKKAVTENLIMFCTAITLIRIGNVMYITLQCHWSTSVSGASRLIHGYWSTDMAMAMPMAMPSMPMGSNDRPFFFNCAPVTFQPWFISSASMES